MEIVLILGAMVSAIAAFWFGLAAFGAAYCQFHPKYVAAKLCLFVCIVLVAVAATCLVLI